MLSLVCLFFYVTVFSRLGGEMPEGPAGLAPDLPDLAGGNQRERGCGPGDDLPVRL